MQLKQTYVTIFMRPSVSQVFAAHQCSHAHRPLYLMCSEPGKRRGG